MRNGGIKLKPTSEKPKIKPAGQKAKRGYKMENIGKILLKKLTPKELAVLCDAYDNGSIEKIFIYILLPKDMKNRPVEYAALDEDIRG